MLVVAELPTSKALAAPAKAACPAVALNENEAARELRLLPKALKAKTLGGKLFAVPWKPGAGFRDDIFYMFMLQSSVGSGTPLGNGMLGYYGVNKWTADVVQLDAEPPFISGRALKRYQAKVRSVHCLEGQISNRRLDRLER